MSAHDSLLDHRERQSEGIKSAAREEALPWWRFKVSR